MKRVTIKDIASHIQLSVSTVSRALADDKNIRKETKQRIFEAASELGYRRNPLAVSLRTGRTDTIGVIAREMITPGTSTVLEGVYSIMRQNGINVIVANSDNDPEKERKNLQMLEDSMVDGIIIDACVSDENTDAFRRLQKKDVPLVFISHAPRGLEEDIVITDDYDKVKILVSEMIKRGRRHIVNIKGTPSTLYNPDIHRAFNDALIEAGMPCRADMTVESAPSFESGLQTVDSLIESGVEFDAIFSYDELVSLGVLHRLHQLGRDVPGKVAVATFGGTRLSSFVYPPLTAVERPLYDMGKRAASILLRRIQDPQKREAPSTHTICSDIIIRESV